MLYSVVIPCYRSDQTIEHVVDQTREEMVRLGRANVEFVLVNDCSPDGGKTIQVLRKMAAEHRDVKVIDLARNSGQHNALMAALRHADGDVIIGMDDDGQTHPSQLGKLFETFDHGYDVDTILCLDGTGVVGTCLAQELTKSGFRTINAHETIYILEPEYNANSQIIFRDNTQGMIRGKHVLVLMASVTTGYTAKRALEAITYYGGTVAGVAAIYSAVDQVEGYPVRAVYTIQDLPGYASYDYRECPYCKAGQKIDALVNSFGYSAL